MSFIKQGFEIIIEEWLLNRIITTIMPFKKAEALHPVVFKSNVNSNNIESSYILNILEEMFLGKEITVKPATIIMYKVAINSNNNLYDNKEVCEVAYERDLENVYTVLGLDYIIKLVCSKFDFNSYVYYLWKRDTENEVDQNT